MCRLAARLGQAGGTVGQADGKEKGSGLLRAPGIVAPRCTQREEMSCYYYYCTHETRRGVKSSRVRASESRLAYEGRLLRCCCEWRYSTVPALLRERRRRQGRLQLPTTRANHALVCVLALSQALVGPLVPARGLPCYDGLVLSPCRLTFRLIKVSSYLAYRPHSRLVVLPRHLHPRAQPLSQLHAHSLRTSRSHRSHQQHHYCSLATAGLGLHFPRRPQHACHMSPSPSPPQGCHTRRHLNHQPA